jgi:hypothetical protein
MLVLIISLFAVTLSVRIRCSLFAVTLSVRIRCSLFAVTLSVRIRCTLMTGHHPGSNAILGAILSIEPEYWTLQIQMSSACYSIYVQYIYNITIGQLHETSRPCNHYVRTMIETYYVCIPFSYSVGYFHRIKKSQKTKKLTQ